MNKRVKSNSIRIIGGHWRGRRLPVLDSKGLRPTTDRVRETLFNWLMAHVDAANCLDAFAGSGALGFECLSRGAGFVQFVESQNRVAEELKANFETLQLAPEKASLVTLDVVKFLSSAATKKFDLVFLDPPFNSGLLPSVLSLLVDRQWLADNALVYIERSDTMPDLVMPGSFELHREGRAGQSHYALYYNN